MFFSGFVLILVVVDDGLVHEALKELSAKFVVLILVVVDDGLVLSAKFVGKKARFRS